MTVLQIDIETFSSVDITKSGVYPYVEAPDFEVLLFGYAFDNEPVEVIDLVDFEDIPDRVLDALWNPDIIKTAYNANFERTALAKHFGQPMPPEQWRCTSVLALTMGLPGTLDQVAKVLKLEQQKDAAGKALIKYFSVPCKPTKVNGQRSRNYPHHAPEKWADYKSYCAQDVETERDVRKKLLKYEPSEFEHKLWVLDQKINDNGIRIDPLLVERAIECDADFQRRRTEEARALTGLENPNSVTQLKMWLEEKEGITVEGLTKDMVPVLLEQVKGEDTRCMLELRQEMSKTSVKKYEAMSRGLCSDSRVRGCSSSMGRTVQGAGQGD